MATATPEVPATKPAPRPRSAQDKQLAKETAAAGQTIRAVMADTEAAPELAEGGYAALELSRGLALQEAAQEALAERLVADGAQDAATKAYLAAQKALTTTYSKLRGLARSAFLKNTDALTALGLTGREPRDLAGQLNAADALARNGVLPPYADKLAKRGVTAAKLQDLQTKVAALQEADRQQEAAKAATPRATAKRDAAVAALSAWLAEFKTFAKAQFKDRPDILKRWGF